MASDSATRRVLLLARHFPPIGGAGVHRSLGYVRYLSAYGYEPVVVTGAGRSDDPWSAQDPELAASIPDGVEVHRLPDTEPSPRQGWWARAARLLRRPQPWVRWWVEGAVRTGRNVGAGADLILASCLPYETAEAGARLSRELGLPWVADLEDPWALDEMRVHATALHYQLDLNQMRHALSSAAAIVMCAPEAAKRMRRALPEQAHERIVAVPIGFDADPFRSAVQTGVGGETGTFRIVHTGSLHTELGLAHRRSRWMRRLLRGTSVDVDILTRSPVFLVEAIERVAETKAPGVGDRIELHLAGELSPADRALIERYDFVRFRGRLGHAESVALMRSADLLFLPMHDLPEGKRAGLIPYKTYEYLAAGRPILAAVPDGDVRDLLAPLDRVSLCRPADVAGMAEAIKGRLERAVTEAGPVDLDTPPLRDLDRRRLTGRAAALFDQVLGVPAPESAVLPRST